MFDVRSFGAHGDGESDDTQALQSTIDECAVRGGGRVVISSGLTCIAGPFRLRSAVDLHVEQGASIRASLDWDLYRNQSAFADNRSEGTVWIRADEAYEVSISGHGTIDGRGIHFMANEEPSHYNYYFDGEHDFRPQLMQLHGCTRVTIHGVTFRDSAHWGLHFIGCNDVTLSDLRILNSLKIRNADAIDIDGSRNVRIANCHIESADDCICLKSRREFAEYGPTENVLVSNCTLVSTSCAFKIGSENVAGIRNVVASNLIITKSNRGLGIQSRDEGIVEDILFSDILIETRRFAEVWWGKAEPISITALPRSECERARHPSDGRGSTGTVRRIRFRGISCRGENGVLIYGSWESRPTDIELERVHVTLTDTTRFGGGEYDLRPCEGDGILRQPVTGFRIHSADCITLHECRAELEHGKHPVAADPIIRHDACVNSVES